MDVIEGREEEEGAMKNGEEEKIAWLTDLILRCPPYPDDE